MKMENLRKKIHFHFNLSSSSSHSEQNAFQSLCNDEKTGSDDCSSDTKSWEFSFLLYIFFSEGLSTLSSMLEQSRSRVAHTTHRIEWSLHIPRLSLVWEGSKKKKEKSCEKSTRPKTNAKILFICCCVSVDTVNTLLFIVLCKTLVYSRVLCVDGAAGWNVRPTFFLLLLFHSFFFWSWGRDTTKLEKSWVCYF